MRRKIEKKEKNEDAIIIDREIQIPGTDIVLEKGDRVKVLREGYKYYYNELKKNLPIGDSPINMKIGDAKTMPLHSDSMDALNDFYGEFVRGIW